jgi:hypothetical protein
MRRALVATGAAARRHAAPGSLRAFAADVAGGEAGGEPAGTDATQPRGRGRGVPLDAPAGDGGAPRAARGRGRADTGGLLSRVLGATSAGVSRGAGDSAAARSHSAPPPGSGEPAAPRAPREGPPRVFTSRRVAASPAQPAFTGQQQAGGPARTYTPRDGARSSFFTRDDAGATSGRGASPPAFSGLLACLAPAPHVMRTAALGLCAPRALTLTCFLRLCLSLAPPSLPDSDASVAGASFSGGGGMQPERRRSRWQSEAAEFTTPRAPSGLRAPSGPRATSPRPAGRQSMEANARARVSRHLEAQPRAAAVRAPYDEDEMNDFLEVTFDPHLDTSDIGLTPQLWDAAPAVTPAELLAAAGAEMRLLSGVEDDAEWAAICEDTLAEWAAMEAAMAGATVRAGNSGLPHVAAEDAALAATAAGAAGSAGAAFAAKAFGVLSRNPRWGYAAKQRALSLMVARAGQ